MAAFGEIYHRKIDVDEAENNAIDLWASVIYCLR